MMLILAWGSAHYSQKQTAAHLLAPAKMAVELFEMETPEDVRLKLEVRGPHSALSDSENQNMNAPSGMCTGMIPSSEKR